MLGPWTGIQCGQAPVLSPQNITPCLFPLDGGKRVGNGGPWWLMSSVTSAALRICKEVPYHGQWVPHSLGLWGICLPFPSLPSPPPTCGRWPFPWVQDLLVFHRKDLCDTRGKPKTSSKFQMRCTCLVEASGGQDQSYVKSSWHVEECNWECSEQSDIPPG